MMTEVGRGVFVPTSMSAIVIFMNSCIMYLPPVRENVGYLIYSIMVVWIMLLVVGLVFLVRLNTLNLIYLIWSNLMFGFGLIISVEMIKVVFTTFEFSDWASNMVFVFMFILSILHMTARFAVGGYKECVKVGRIIPSSFYFHIDRPIDFELRIEKLSPFQLRIRQFSTPIVAASGAIGGVLLGQGLFGIMLGFGACLSLFLCCWFLFKIQLPDLIFCARAGFDGANSHYRN